VQVSGQAVSAIVGFETEADAEKAATLIKKATVSKRKRNCRLGNCEHGDVEP
jgi:hypothetical protein